MMNHPLMCIVCKVSWLIVSLAAINVGVRPFGYDFFMFLANNTPALVNPVSYIVGIAGVISLLMLIYKVAGGCKDGSCHQ